MLQRPTACDCGRQVGGAAPQPCRFCGLRLCIMCCPPYQPCSQERPLFSACPQCLHQYMQAAQHCLRCGLFVQVPQWHEVLCPMCRPSCQHYVTLHLEVPALSEHLDICSVTLRENVGQTLLEMMSKFGLNPRNSFSNKGGAVIPPNALIWHRDITLIHQTLAWSGRGQVIFQGPVRHATAISLPCSLAKAHHPAGLAFL